MRQLGPYTRHIFLGRIDGRTRLARLARETRRDLLGECGPKPSVIQRTMIDQIIQLKLRLAAMDIKFAETGARTDHDARTYLAWSNSLVRLLRDLSAGNTKSKRPPSVAALLGVRAAKSEPAEKPPSLKELLRQRHDGFPV